jgi:hypothetical protein
VPVENFAPQGPMQSDLNGGGHSIPNVNAFVATNSAALPTNTTVGRTNFGTAAFAPASNFVPTSALGTGVDAALIVPLNSSGGFIAYGAPMNFDGGAIASDGSGDLTINSLSSDGGQVATNGSGTMTLNVAIFSGDGAGIGFDGGGGIFLSTLNDDSNVWAADWNQRWLYDFNQTTSVDWGNRVLYANDGATVIFQWDTTTDAQTSISALIDTSDSSHLRAGDGSFLATSTFQPAPLITTTVTLVAGAATLTNASLTTTSVLEGHSVNGTPSANSSMVYAIAAAGSMQIKAANSSDTDTLNLRILQ